MAEADKQDHPFARPGFVIASAVVTLIVIVGLILGIVYATRDDNPPVTTPPEVSPPPSSSASTQTTPAPTQVAGNQSVCGLSGAVPAGATLTKAPEAKWKYQDLLAYPTSEKFGPKAAKDGVRYCFQRSPEGAVFAAANAAIQGSGDSSDEWIKYFLSAKTPNREALLGSPGTGGGGSSSSIRMAIVGFNLLTYEEDSARVDIAVEATVSGRVVYGSTVYDLVWEAEIGSCSRET